VTPGRGTKIFYGNWITVLMMYVLFFTAGMGLYTYQVFVPRFVEAFGWTMFETVAPAALWAVVFGLSGFFVGGWIQRFGARRVIVAGAVGGAVLFFLISLLTQLWQLYVLLMLSGITVAATTLVPAQTVVTLWFDKKRGRNMGVAMMGVGLGGLALSPVAAWLIQEVGWRATYRLQALAMLVLVVPPVLLFLKNRPSDIGEVPDGRAGTASGHEPSPALRGVRASRAIRSLTFWLLFFAYLTQLYVTSAVNVNTTAFAESIGYTALVAPLFLAVAVGVSVPGRFFYGWLTDHIGPHLLMASAGMLLSLSMIALVVFTIRLGWVGAVPIWTFGIAQGLGIAGSTVALPILVGRCFGELEFGKIQGLVMAGFSLGVIFGGPSAARIFDTTGSYELAWLVCTGMGLVSVVLALMVRPSALHAEFESTDATGGSAGAAKVALSTSSVVG
jgi:OFA family oxalate/formate antiporter-like MFS transporter